MKSDKEISKTYKLDKWKWKMMLNDPKTKIRSIIYAKKRPDDIPIPVLQRQGEPI